MRRFIILAFVFALLFSACNSKKNTLQLVETSLQAEVNTSGNFSFYFDKYIAPDSVLFVWDSTEYISFSPEIEGLFKWTDGNLLIFSPKNALPPATEFKAVFNNSISQFDEKITSVDIDPIYFQTSTIRLDNSSLYWFLDGDNNSVAKLDLVFNYPIATEDVLSKLTVTLDDKALEIVPDDIYENYFQTFTLPTIPVEDKDVMLSITLKSGLTPVFGKIGTSDDMSLGKLLKSPFKLDINEVLTDHNGSEGSIEVVTSQSVSEKDLSQYIKLSPSVSFSTELTNKGFKIKSSGFDVTTKYSLTILEGLMGKVGGKLASDYKKDIAFGELEPDIYFEHNKGFYLSGNGFRNIAVRIVSMDEVTVTISKLYENNILAAQDYGSYSDYWYEDYGYYNSSQLEDVIFEKTYETKDLPRQGMATLLHLDFEDELKKFPGIYHIKVSSNEDYWLQDSRLVSISDLGLIAKKGQNKLLMFANSLKTTEAVSGVEMKLYGQNNQVIGEATTGSDGVATFTLSKKDYSGFEPAFISATKGDDYTVLQLRNTEVYTSRFDVGGYRSLPNGLQTYIYFERDIYRPGETVNVATIVRNQNWETPGSLPIRIEIKLPNGKTLKTLKKTLNNEGSFDASFETAANNVTGRYTVYVYSSTDVLLASKSVLVEEFMPDRIKVTTEFTNESLGINEETQLNIDAQNLFGTPAINRNYEVELSYKRRYFSPEGFSGYNFNIANTNSYFDKDVRSGTTDNEGKAQEFYTVPEEYENMGVLQADVFTTVFDETGRPVNRRNTLNIYTQDIFYGIGYNGYYFTTNAQATFPLVAVDKNGKALNNTSARVQVIKHEYKTVLNKSGSSFRYESVKVEQEMVNKVITLNGKYDFNFTPMTSGSYEVRVYHPDVRNRYVSHYFYAYGYGRTNLSSFEVDNEGRIEMEFDKESYEVGDMAKILFKTPFQGKMLVTLEGKEVLEHFYVNTDKRSAEVSISLSEFYLPNVYVSATLFKEHESTEFPLTVAHGFKSMTINDSKRQIPVSIDAVSESRSKTKQTITVSTKPNAKLTIAVVDEGILQVSGFQTPDPYNYFYQKRALQVNSYDVYPYLYPELSASSAGGDGFDLEKRVNPMNNNRVKLVSFWSGMVTANNAGKATFDIDIPQFSGSLRVMAVSHKDQSFGANEANITVADPIVMSSAIPRFLSPGDTAVITTTLSNTTTKSTKAKASIKVEGPFKVIGSSTVNTDIANKNEAQVSFKVLAQNEIGSGKITVTCNAMGENFTEETELTVRPASPLLKVTGSGAIKAGNSQNIEMKQSQFISNTADYKLVVSKNPMVEFGEDLDYLLRYPYGCTEQTISAAFPQLYFNDISIAMYKDDSKAEDVLNNINAAITKLKLRQTYNGGLTMWGNGEANWWVTAYGAHFLVEAKKAGYDYDPSLLEYCLGYLEKRLQSKETTTYYYNNNQTKKIAPKEVPYSLYVLALANQADVSLMNYYKSNTDILSIDGRYLLGAAYALAGDKTKGKQLLPNSFEGEKANREFGGSFSSPFRQEAIALNALLEIDPNHSQIGTMAMHVSDYLKNQPYLNTQDRIYGLLALGKIAQAANKSNIAAQITADGKTIGSYDKGTLTFATAELMNKKIEIKTTGSGSLYYFWEAEGISSDGTFVEEDNYLKVRKTFYDRYGDPLISNTFKQNDLVVVKLSIEKSYNSTIENVVITDVLPAGFEIENPRTDEIPGIDWIKYQTYPDHRDIRDDRINLFDDVYISNGKTQNYYYVVRAVSLGTFTMGPVAADAMYNGEYHSYNGGGKITIVK